MNDKKEPETHVRTIKDVLDLFEPFLTTEDIQECIEELERLSEQHSYHVGTYLREGEQ